MVLEARLNVEEGGGRMSHDVPAGALARVKPTFPPGDEERRGLLPAQHLNQTRLECGFGVPKRICEMFIY